MNQDDQKFVKLEEEIAHLTISSDEISSEILAQWKRIEELEKTVLKLQNRLMAMEETFNNPVITTKPPHW